MTEAQHVVLRRSAFEAGVSMMEWLRGKIGVGVTVVSKPISETVNAIGVKPMEKVSMEPVGEVIQEKCKRCFESFPVTMLIVDPRTGNKFCGDCVENMKG